MQMYREEAEAITEAKRARFSELEQREVEEGNKRKADAQKADPDRVDSPPTSPMRQDSQSAPTSPVRGWESGTESFGESMGDSSEEEEQQASQASNVSTEEQQASQASNVSTASTPSQGGPGNIGRNRNPFPEDISDQDNRRGRDMPIIFSDVSDDLVSYIS
jgi:hypothetical protein